MAHMDYKGTSGFDDEGWAAKENITGGGEKTLHGKTKGFTGTPKGYEGQSYPHHKNAQGQEVFGPGRSPKDGDFKYAMHLNAYGRQILGPKRSPGIKYNFPHGKVMPGKGDQVTTIRAETGKGGKGVIRPMGGLV